MRTSLIDGLARISRRFFLAACMMPLLLVGAVERADAATAVELAAYRPAPQMVVRARDAKAARVGPSIEVRSLIDDPTWSVEAPVELVFRPGPEGHRVNMRSLKVTYRKAWGFDITDRLADYIDGDVIRVPSAELPGGQHEVEIYIEDDRRNVTRVVLAVTIPE